MKFSLVIPFHSDIDKILVTLEFLKKEAGKNGIDEILLCHNGSPLPSESEQRIKAALFSPCKLLHTDKKGIGAGYKLGIERASGEYVILSASDLPFGWTDLEAFKKSPSDFAIGSKAHPKSVLKGITRFRRVMSFVFYVLRCMILGRQTPGDSQGSFFVRTDLAKKLIGPSQFDNYLFSLELATHQLKSGGKVQELPIRVINNDGQSSVSASTDSLQMFKDLFALRKQLRD